MKKILALTLSVGLLALVGFRTAYAVPVKKVGIEVKAKTYPLDNVAYIASSIEHRIFPKVSYATLPVLVWRVDTPLFKVEPACNDPT